MTDRTQSLSSAMGTVVAKGLAFTRNLVLAAAIGTGVVGDSFALANNLPNMIFLLIGGGAVATILVPQITRLRVRSAGLSDQFSSLLIVSIATACSVVVIALALANPILMTAFGAGSWSAGQQDLTASFALWCLPLILLHALSAIQSQVLFARRRFAIAAWAPMIVPVPVIVACVIIAVDPATRLDAPEEFLEWHTVMLGSSVLLGGALHVVWLAIASHRAGYRFKLPRSLRGLGLGSTARLGWWTLISTGTFAGGSILLTVLLTRAGAEAAAEGVLGRGYAAFLLAQIIITFVNSVVIAAIGNPHIVAIAESNANGSPEMAQKATREALVRVATLMVPASMVLLVIAFPIALGALGTFGIERGDMQAIGLTLALLAVGLIPSTTHMVVLRTFYALGRSLPPLWSSVRINLISVGIPLISAFFVPPESLMWIAAGAWSAAYWIDAPIKALRLRKLMTPRVTAGVGRLVVGVGIRCTCVGSVVVAGVVLLSLQQQSVLALVPITVGALVFLIGYSAVTWRHPHGLRETLRSIRG